MRISRHRMFMDVASAVARRSTCHRLNVGAVIVDINHNIRSIGYNGVPSGKPHCSEVESRQGSCSCIHAEANALERHGPKAPFAIYVTHSPCRNCMRLLIKAQVEILIFESYYRRAEHLPAASGKIKIYQILPSDVVLEFGTGRIVQ